jgi:hypothetical protein
MSNDVEKVTGDVRLDLRCWHEAAKPLGVSTDDREALDAHISETLGFNSDHSSSRAPACRIAGREFQSQATEFKIQILHLAFHGEVWSCRSWRPHLRAEELNRPFAWEKTLVKLMAFGE